ncbi:HTH-type transcriptional repressor YtrA [Oxobacter pfennigii]|uniref:HTH-type transcriptional repressor YtrA n=1 Tax=Oxobacter pfennigii TaxID=36849 RepID=A0A0P8WCY3_9CLOT|nr:GntR family transcriptional regulator [Oxobacter pfennigii]KPU45622.1 HTH-type transcriptional repressor YtrA [Oxobacter pfennigii]
MISFEQFIIEDGTPIYMQIVRHIKQGIIAGSIQDGEELPSRRVLSALLGVNPNTVQKAYRLLEEEAIIESHSGAKSYAVLDEAKVESIRRQLLESDARAIINAMKKMGVSKEEAISLVDKLWQ